MEVEINKVNVELELAVHDGKMRIDNRPSRNVHRCAISAIHHWGREME